MQSRKNLMLFVFLILFAVIVYGANRQVYGLRHPDFTVFSNANYGVSLLYDTLLHLRQPVSILYRPLNSGADINKAVFIVEPTNPGVNMAMAEEILSWVRQGGRLVYLENTVPNIIDRALDGSYEISALATGNMRLYRVGLGEILTGRADIISNIHLTEGSLYGEGILYVLNRWNPAQIYFAEYYHGYHAPDSFFRQLPISIQMAAFQLIIAAVIFSWHLGKRFGEPVPLYEEIEREENEQVLSLARLYKKNDVI